jgi:uncharacterized protein (DUF58 family)
MMGVKKLLDAKITMATMPILNRRPPRPAEIRMRLTPAGWGFVGLMSCSFVLSVNFSNNLIFAMTFLLVSIALLGWVQTRLNVSGLSAADWKCDDVFAGQDAVCRLALENRKGEDRFGLRGFVPASHTAAPLHLSGRERVEVTLTRPAPVRGRLDAIPAAIRSGFPLGIFEARLGTNSLPECLVYPAPEGDEPLSAKASDRQAHLSSEAGEYRDTRRYSPGDPLSRIDWKAMARFDELYTKEFDGARGRAALWLRWDDVRAQGEERKLSQLCRWVLDAHRRNIEYGLEIPGATIAPSSGDGHRLACLRALALYN